MKIRHIAAALTVAGGIVASALTGVPAAGASEINCQLANYCGTLHGIDAVGTPVALDAKKKADLGINIAYPDLPGDRATSYSLVPHQGFGRWVYTDKTFTGSFAQTSPVLTDGATSPLVVKVDASNGTLSFGYTGTHGDSVSVGLSGLPELPSTVSLSDAITNGTFVGSTPIPAYLRTNNYAVTVTVTDTPPVVSTANPVITTTGTLTLSVTADAVWSPAKPYYTIVYVTENGTWTSDCVTALPGGLLKNEPCTWGRDPSQMFEFISGGVPVTVVPGTEYSVLNVGSRGYLESQSGLLPAQLLVPQSDAADAAVYTGRQLDVNGTDANQWVFGS